MGMVGTGNHKGGGKKLRSEAFFALVNDYTNNRPNPAEEKRYHFRIFYFF